MDEYNVPCPFEEEQLTDFKSSCFMMTYRNLEMAPSVGMVRFLLRLAILGHGSGKCSERKKLDVKMW